MMVKCVRNESLQFLGLSSCELTDLSVQLLDHILHQSCCLKELDFSYNEPSASTCLLLQNSMLISLELSGNLIDDFPGPSVGECIASNCFLRTLCLNNTTCDMCDIADALQKNSTLESLSLSRVVYGNVRDGIALGKALAVNEGLR